MPEILSDHWADECRYGMMQGRVKTSRKRKKKSILPERRGEQIAWLVFYSLIMFLLGAIAWKYLGPMV